MGGAAKSPVGLALAACVLLTGCAVEARPAAPPPQIPTIVAPTTASRVPVMADRPLPENCDEIVPGDQINQALGQELPGEGQQIVGVPEESVGRTGKIDCYYGIPPGKQISAAMLIVGLATYTDELTARNRVTDSIEAERTDGAKITDVEVGKQRGNLVATGEERLLIGSLGKTTFVVRAKVGVLPEDKVGAVLAGLAAQTMTAPIS
jgi:hypothetical protein